MAVAEHTSRVRPGFRRFAIVAFVLLLPIALHTAWDHYEARRLSQIVADIRAKGEPATQTPTMPAAESPQNAARYYEAAAALVDARDFYGATGLLTRIQHAPDSERPQLLQDIRAWLERNREAEALLARATALSFEGYPPGTSYSYRSDRLFKLARLANLRAFERLELGDGEAAAASVIQQLRINRPLVASGPNDLSVIGMGWAATPALRQTNRLLAANPPDRSLEQIQQAIHELDNDDALQHSVLAERAFWVGQYWNESRRWYTRPPREASGNPLWFVVRPLTTRRFVEMIEIMTSLVDRARQPWPERLHVDVPDTPPGSRGPRGFPFLPSADAKHMLGSSYRSRASNVATALALGRSADAAIAVERYRRVTGDLPDSLVQLVPTYLARIPIDPFSGREIRYLPTPDRAVVYSIGVNEKDDGGETVDYPARPSNTFQNRDEPPDFGVAIQVSPRRNR